jgi:hypothetical protein
LRAAPDHALDQVFADGAGALDTALQSAADRQEFF